jgi:hypothetical protein
MACSITVSHSWIANRLGMQSAANTSQHGRRFGGEPERQNCVFWMDARSEEGEFPLWSLTDERQGSWPKTRSPEGCDETDGQG